MAWGGGAFACCLCWGGKRNSTSPSAEDPRDPTMDNGQWTFSRLIGWPKWGPPKGPHSARHPQVLKRSLCHARYARWKQGGWPAFLWCSWRGPARRYEVCADPVDAKICHCTGCQQLRAGGSAKATHTNTQLPRKRMKSKMLGIR